MVWRKLAELGVPGVVLIFWEGGPHLKKWLAGFGGRGPLRGGGYEMHEPHILIGSQYRPAVCLRLPWKIYIPGIYGETVQHSNLQKKGGLSMSSVAVLELSQPLFLQRWVWDRSSKVKTPIYQTYNQIVLQTLLTTKSRPQSAGPIKVAHHLLSPIHCLKHHIANLASLIAVPSTIIEGLMHTLVARPPWCGSDPCVRGPDTPCNRKPRHKTSQSIMHWRNRTSESTMVCWPTMSFRSPY